MSKCRSRARGAGRAKPQGVGTVAVCADMFAVAGAPLACACPAVSRADLRGFPSQFVEISVLLRVV